MKEMIANKSIIAAAMLLSLSSIGMNANAAGLPEIRFTGQVTTSTCRLANDTEVLNVNLPPVGKAGVVAVSQVRAVETFAFTVNCESETGGDKDSQADARTVTMAFMPMLNSFNGQVLNNTATGESAAQGVGIVMFDNDNKSIDFDDTASTRISVPLDGNQAIIRLAAAYAQDGSGEEVKAGVVTANLPFTMTYQ